MQGGYPLLCGETGKMRANEDKLTDIYPVWIKGENTEQDNLIVADEVELINDHLMFYWKKQLVFKVWLKKDYKNIKEALKDVGVRYCKVK